MMKFKIFLICLIGLLSLTLLSVTSYAMTDAICLQETEFSRQKGKPVTYTEEFEARYDGLGTLTITTNSLVTSARITFNGQQVLAPGDFKERITSYVADVTLVDGTNILEVYDESKPGSMLWAQVSHPVDADAAAYCGPAGCSFEVTDPQSEFVGAGFYAPPGALPANTLVTIADGGFSSHPTAGFVSAGPIIKFGPDGTVFTSDIFLTLLYDDHDHDGIVDYSDIPEEQVSAITFNPSTGQWEDLNIVSRDFLNNTVTVETNHISCFTTAIPESHSDKKVSIFTIDGLSFSVIFSDIPAAIGDAIHDDFRPGYLNEAILEKQVFDLGLKRGDVISYSGPYCSSGDVSWDGNANNTSDLIANLRNELRLQYLKAKNENKRFLIVTHSWGTILGMLALAYEADIDPDVFITLSTPLGTQNIDVPWWSPLDALISAFISNYTNTRINETESNNGSFARTIDNFNFPWINYWAMGDMISGPLNLANLQDTQIDASYDIKREFVCETFIWHAVTSISKKQMHKVFSYQPLCLLENVGTVYKDYGKSFIYEVKSELYKIIEKDSDGDTFPYYFDCDDTNPDINPGAEEICDDGIDQDCDELVDCDDPDCSSDPSCTAGGLVAHWSFDNQADPGHDDSNNGHDGQVFSATWTPNGAVGGAMSFDGIDDYILVPSNPSLQLNTYTITAWVKPDVITWGNRIVEKGESNSYYLYINYSAKALVGFFDGSYHDITSTESIIPDNWYFIAGSYDGTISKIYINGVLDNELLIDSQPIQNDEPLLIGWKYNGIQEDHFDGLIDEVRIYNRALTEAEIQELYNLRSQEETLASDLSSPNFIAVDQSNVYWTSGTYSNPSVNMIDLITGNIKTFDCVNWVGARGTEVLADNGLIYWGVTSGYGTGAIYKVPSNGSCNDVIQLTSANQPQDMAIDNTFLYWADNNCGTYGSNAVRKIPKSGGNVISLTYGTCHGVMDMDNTDIYFKYVYANTMRIGKVSKNGGPTTVLAGLGPTYPISPGVAGIAVDDLFVYWTEANTGKVKKVNKNGGEVTTLADGLDKPYRIVVDSDYVYLTEHANFTPGAGTIKKVPKSGGVVTVVASDLNTPWDIAIDDNYVYWTEQGTDGTDGAVRKISKNTP